MLCDEILKTYAGKNFARDRAFEEGRIDEMTNKIRIAHKFVFNEETTKVIVDAKGMKPSALLSMLDFAKPPYDLTWVEFPKISYGANTEFDDLTNKPKTKRVGFLVETRNDDEILITMGYAFRPPLNCGEINHLCLSFKKHSNVKSQGTSLPIILPDQLQSNNPAPATDEVERILLNAERFAATLSPKEHECMDAIQDMFSYVANPVFFNTLLRKKSRDGQQAFDELTQSLFADWCGEELMSLLAFAFLSCRNVFETTEITAPEKLNRARVKRGKEPFFSYHIVDLKSGMKERLRESANTGIQQRSHWVRGHFKERKTGRFFWNPHLAGNPDLGFVVKDYRV